MRCTADHLADPVRAGETGAGVFLVDMNKVFEAFVAARLARYLGGRLTVSSQRTEPLAVDRTVKIKIRPDLVFERGARKVVYVADTKYKISADGFARDADYYQILAYTRALDVPEGMLIYCQRDGDVPPRHIEVGKHKARLLTRALGLGGTPEDVERRVRELAGQIADRVEPPVGDLL